MKCQRHGKTTSLNIQLLAHLDRAPQRDGVVSCRPLSLIPAVPLLAFLDAFRIERLDCLIRYKIAVLRFKNG